MKQPPSIAPMAPWVGRRGPFDSFVPPGNVPKALSGLPEGLGARRIEGRLALPLGTPHPTLFPHWLISHREPSPALAHPLPHDLVRCGVKTSERHTEDGRPYRIALSLGGFHRSKRRDSML